MEQPKPNEQSESAADTMNRLHNLASEHPDPEKDEIAKKLLEQWEKAQEEGNSDEVIRLIGEIDKLYDGTPKDSEKTPNEHVEAQAEQTQDAKEHDGLKENGTVVVGPLSGEFDPNNFFRNYNKSAKLNIRDNFNKNIQCRKVREEQPRSTISFYTLKKAMGDSEIWFKLPAGSYFSLDDYWIIAELLNKQPNGESGELLNDAQANIFYVQVGANICVVGVYWTGSCWSIEGWNLGEHIEDIGCRIFSRRG
jgi:hypothetical protein